MSNVNLDCYMQFKKEKEDTFVTCGVVLVHESEEIFTDFETYADGLYGNGLLAQLFKVLDFINLNVNVHGEDGINIYIKAHPGNTNFIKILDKVAKGYRLVKGVDNEVSLNFVLTQFLTNKDYSKPKTYDSMITTIKALKVVNRKQPVHLVVGLDGASSNMERTYLECVGRNTTYRANNGVPDTVA